MFAFACVLSVVQRVTGMCENSYVCMFIFDNSVLSLHNNHSHIHMHIHTSLSPVGKHYV